MSKKSFFRNILLTYSCIVGILLMLLFSVVTIRTQNANVRRERDAWITSFSGCVDRWENEFSSLFTMSQSIRSLPAFDRFALCLPKDYYFRLTELYDELKRFNKIVTGEKYDFLVHRSDDSTVITNSGTRELSFALDELGISQDEYYQMIQKAAAESMYPENYVLTDDMLLYLYVSDYIDTQMVVVLYTPMSKLDAYSASMTLPFSLLANDTKITDWRTNVTAPELSDAGSLEKVPVRQPIVQSGVHSDFVLASSAYMELFYAAQLPALDAKDVMQFVLQMLLGFFVISAISYAIVRVFSTRLYRPVENLINTFIEFSSENESLENENEIDFMARQVVRIRGRNQELTRKLEVKNKLFKDRSLKYLLSGKLSEQECRSLPKQLGEEWLADPLRAVLFDFEDLEKVQSAQAESNPENLAHLIAESMQKEMKCIFVQTNLSSVCFLVSQTNIENLHKALASIINVVDAAFHFSVCAFISTVCMEVQGIPQAFSETIRLKENRNQLPVKSIYTEKDFDRIPAERVIYPLSLETAILESIVNGNFKEVKRYVDLMFDEYINKNFNDFNLRDMAIFALINTLNRALEVSSVSPEMLSGQGKYLLLELRSCNTAEELKEYVLQRFEEIVEEVHVSANKKTQDFQENLKAYIEQNYQKDISLLDIAEQFALSPTYMSLVFKNTMGDNFKDYLSQIRFERAVELLYQEPGIKLNELGERIGITNVNTLIRVFKKHSGLTPGQYARKKLQDQ